MKKRRKKDDLQNNRTTQNSRIRPPPSQRKTTKKWKKNLGEDHPSIPKLIKLHWEVIGKVPVTHI